jgi:hypothetical protein
MRPTRAKPPRAKTGALPTLYHYTTADGLHAMLQSGHVWATDCFYLNDPHELRYGFDVVRAVAEKMLGQKKSPALQQFIEHLPITIQDKLEQGRVYLVSFCTKGDLLSQWRGYAAAGGGYAIGFDPSRLYGRTKYEKEPYRVLRQVVYTLAEQERIIQQWLQREVVKAPLEHAEYELLMLFSDHLMFFKNPSYDEEGEWRLVLFGRHTDNSWVWPAKYRVRGGQIIPYADFDLTKSTGPLAGKLPINTIVCGPGVNWPRARKSLTSLCESLGYRCRSHEGWDQVAVEPGTVDIRRSIIPFVPTTP